MNYLNELLPLNQQEFRSYVKSRSEDTAFISELIAEKETYLPLLLKNRSVPQLVEDKILEQKNRSKIFIRQIYRI